MNRLFFAKKYLTIILLLLLTSTVAYSQNRDGELEGDGTEWFPYLISDNMDWKIFVGYVEGNHADAYYKMTNDITIGEANAVLHLIGTDDKPFTGHFDGDWHTLTVTINSSSEGYKADYVAPFGVVDGATITNLTVRGNLTTASLQYMGGIVAYVKNSAKGETVIQNCTSSVTITSSYASTKAGYHGGVVGKVTDGTLLLENCIFDGSMNTRRTSNCAGLIGLVDASSTTTIKTSTQAYTDLNVDDTFKTFYQLNGLASVTLNNVYYLRQDSGWAQGGTAALTSAGSIGKNVIAKKYTRSKTTYYVPSVVVSNLATVYSNGANDVDPNPTLTYYGRELVRNTDYTITVNATNIVISSNTNNYYGTVSTTYSTVDVSDWDKLKTQLRSNTSKVRHFVLKAGGNYSTSGAGKELMIEGGGAVTLKLNGQTLNRNLTEPTNNGYVIMSSSSSNVTIIGPGTITGGNQYGDGGCIVNKNRMTIKNHVVITNNKANKQDSKALWGIGGGVYMNGAKYTLIEDCEISNNQAYGGGGGICTGVANGVYTTNGYFIIRNCTISGNRSSSKGGGIRVKGTAGIIDNCLVTDNTLDGVDTQDGAGIYNENSKNLIIVGCTITNNNAEDKGGGFFSLNKDNMTLIKDCTFKHNSALLAGGGGIYIYEGHVVLDGVNIVDNLSNICGGVHVRTGVHALKIKGGTRIVDNIGHAQRKNVYLENTSDLIEIVGPLNDNTLIYVSRNSEGVITSGFGANGGQAKHFVCDNYQYYWFTVVGGEVSAMATLYWKNKPWENNAYKKYFSSVTVNGVKTFQIEAPIIIDNNVTSLPNNNVGLKVANEGFIFLNANGGQLHYSCNQVPVTVFVLKEINAAPTGKEDEVEAAKEVYGWNAISAPVADVILGGDNPTTNLITAYNSPYNFDLIRYNEADRLWETYVAHANSDFKLMETGRGYLYRNTSKIYLEYIGRVVTDDVEFTNISCTGTDDYAGWNLIGNPYTHNITLRNITLCDKKGAIEKQLTGYYLPNDKGGWGSEITTAVKCGQGMLVKIPAEAMIVKFSKTSRAERANSEFIKFTVENSEYEDHTFALFDEGYGLPKIDHRNPEIPKLYINKDGNYAVAALGDDVKTFNLNFKAMTTGRYTLSYETEGVFDYLHVIDRLTGEDIDMLLEGEYTFMATPRDLESRFVVRLVYKPSYSDDGDIFAYQSDTDILVSGEGEFQMYDVMGRLVAERRVNGVERISTSSLQTGVYVLRLDDKTQKIVVR